MFTAIGRRRDREHDGRAWQAWHTAVIPYIKPVPELADLMSKSSGGGPKVQTMAEQISHAMAWTAAIQAQP
ncbi:hypothetical protein [Caulobacter sp. DWR3-1-2]|uniref:hypothetical protein n=1 Tax=Caulobacter sp. DWR3-1-2 TaxID=2804647 RepID=UPI003CF80DBE